MALGSNSNNMHYLFSKVGMCSHFLNGSQKYLIVEISWNHGLDETMYWAFIFILGGVRQPQPSEIVTQPHCIKNAWNACQRLLGHQDWHIVLVLNFVLPEFFYTISSISFILNVSLWSEMPLHNNREKNHIIMYNNRMCSHYILVSGVGVQSLCGWMKLTWLSLLKCLIQTFVMHENIHTLREILCCIGM